jgi:hypothetical protein
MCGWVGVEISKSRKRKAGDPEFGLYRVRGSMPVVWSIGPGDAEIDRSPGQSQPTLWTPYAFTLAGIFLAVQNSIQGGTPAGPTSLTIEVANWKPGDGLPYRTVPTRWTSNYRGRRDLGVRGGELKWGVKTEAARGLSMRVWNGMSTAEQQDRGMAQMLDRNYLRNKFSLQTPRQRQREQNAEFHAEHLERRKYGLRARYAAKMRRDRRPND